MKVKVKSLGVIERKGYYFLNAVTQFGEILSAFVPKESVDLVRKTYPSDRVYVGDVIPIIRKGQASFVLSYDLPDRQPLF